MKKLIAALAALTALQASSQELPPYEFIRAMEGTIQTELQRDSSGGMINACGFSFSALAIDNTENKGRPVRIIGSYYLRAMKGSAAFTLKLGAQDLSGADLGTKSMAVLGQVHIQDDKQDPVLPAFSTEAEMPGYALYGFTMNSASLSVWERLFRDGVLVIGFNRGVGKKDIIIPIDATVTQAKVGTSGMERPKSRAMLRELNACSSKLIEKIAADIQAEAAK